MSAVVEQVDRDAAKDWRADCMLGRCADHNEIHEELHARGRLAGRKEAAGLLRAGEPAWEAINATAPLIDRLEALADLIDPPTSKLGIPGKVWSAKG